MLQTRNHSIKFQFVAVTSRLTSNFCLFFSDAFFYFFSKYFLICTKIPSKEWRETLFTVFFIHQTPIDFISFQTFFFRLLLYGIASSHLQRNRVSKNSLLRTTFGIYRLLSLMIIPKKWVEDFIHFLKSNMMQSYILMMMRSYVIKKLVIIFLKNFFNLQILYHQISHLNLQFFQIFLAESLK